MKGNEKDHNLALEPLFDLQITAYNAPPVIPAITPSTSFIKNQVMPMIFAERCLFFILVEHIHPSIRGPP